MIHLTDYVSPERVSFLKSASKADALREMVELISKDPRVGDKGKLLEAIAARDEIVSTGIGFGIAIPHARIESVKRLCMAVGLSQAGVDYPSIDDKPVKILVLIAASAQDQNLYLRVLSRVMPFLKKEREALLASKTPAEAYELLKRY